jgi:hypothetical protein
MAMRSRQRRSVEAWRCCGPSQPLPAVNQHHFPAPTERPPCRESASNGHPIAARMIGEGLEGCGPSQPWPAVNQHHFTAPTTRRMNIQLARVSAMMQ